MSRSRSHGGPGHGDGLGADCAVAIGGGSTIGLGKAIALEPGCRSSPFPTTYAGSEMTPICGLTEAGLKKTGRDLRVLPQDGDLRPGAHPDAAAWRSSVTSGINAIAHAAEGLYARDANPIISLMAEEAIRALGRALPGVACRRRDDLDARGRLPSTAPGCAARCSAPSAWPCITSCATRSAARSTCRTPRPTRSSCRTPWPTTRERPPKPCAAIARALGTAEAPIGVYELARRLGAPQSLRDLGMSKADIDVAADLATTEPYWNPRPVTRELIRTLLLHAFDGAPPSA